MVLINSFHYFPPRTKEMKDEKSELELEAEIEMKLSEPEVLLKNCFEKDSKEGMEEIAEFMVKEYHFKTIAGTKSERDRIYVYKDGVYVLGAERIIREFAQRILEKLCSAYHTREIIEKIKCKTFVNEDIFENTSKDLVCLNNGVLNIRTKEFGNHDPQWVFTTKIPIDYKPETDCPTIKKFFEETMFPEQVAIAEELFGFCLFREYFIKKAMILLGPTDTGKTTFLKLLVAFVGKDNTSEISLHQINRDRFASAFLKGNQLNIFDDLSFVDIADVGGFKIATGDGWVNGQYKFGDYFKFMNFAKLVFATNQIPQPKLQSDNHDLAYYGRWIILDFGNVVNEDKRDPNLFAKLTTPEELSGLLNLALKGLDRLFANNKFSDPRNVLEIKAIMLNSGSNISSFAQTQLEEDPDGWIPKDDLYATYVEYTQTLDEKQRWAASINSVGRNLQKFANYIVDGGLKYVRTESGSKRVRSWQNVSFTNPEKRQLNLEKQKVVNTLELK